MTAQHVEHDPSPKNIDDDEIIGKDFRSWEMP